MALADVAARSSFDSTAQNSPLRRSRSPSSSHRSAVSSLHPTAGEPLTPYDFWLKHYREEEESYIAIYESQEEMLRNLTNELYRLLVMFTVFQGVIFSAVSQSTVLTCKNRWIPMCLSSIVLVATVLAVTQKVVSISKLRGKIDKNKGRAAAVYDKIGDLKSQWETNPDLCTEPTRDADAEMGCLGHASSEHGIFLLIFLLVILLSFDGFILQFCRVLCEECHCP